MFKKSSTRLLIPVLAVVCLTVLADLPASAQTNRVPIVVKAQQAVSPPLSTLKPAAQWSGPLVVRDIEHIPLHLVPASPDGALQSSKGPLVGTVDGLSFDALSQNGYIPPDSNGAIGATQYVTWINVELAIYNKTTGALISGPIQGNTLFSALGGPCANNNDGDPVATYDKINDRWVLTQPVFVAPYYDCFAVSQTSDATGAYNLYAFPLGSVDFPDYPKTGVWPDAYYRTYNLFTSGYLGPEACAYDGAKMRAGLAATSVCFSLAGEGDGDGSLLPADFDGTALPPSGENEFFIQLGPNTTDTRLFEFKMHTDFVVPTNSTFTGPITITVPSYTVTCGGGNGACVPQKGTGQLVDALGDRIMYRLPYRNFPGDHETLLGAHTVTSGGVYGVRWYEIRDPNGSPTAYQAATFQPDSNYRFVPSIAMDQAGDIAVGYSISSSSVFPEIAYTGRVPSDPLNTLETEDVTKVGLGSMAANRWGDYTAMTVDPADDCTLWYINQYQYTTGTTDNWRNRVNNFKFNGCGGPPVPDFTLTATPASQTVIAGASTSYTVTVSPLNGFTGSVTLSSSGYPSGAGGTFTVNPITGGSGTSVLNVTTSNTTPPGTYTLTISGVSGALNHSTTVSLVVVIPDFTLTATPSSQTVTAGNPTSYTATVAPLNGFTGSVTLSASGFPSGASGTFTVNPITGGSGSSTLNVTTSNTTPAGTYTLTISGVSGALNHSTTVSLVVVSAGQVTITPTSLVFGRQVLHTTSAAKKITVKNTGSVTVNFTSVAASGDFAISSNGCVGGLAVGASCLTMVTFTPTAAGTRTGSVTYTDSASGSPQSVSLSGTGVLAATLAPVSGTFKQAELTTSAAKAFTLTNNQSVTLNVSSVAVSADYAETDNCTPTVAPLGHCTINVTFTPPGVGTFNGTLTVTDDAANSPQSSTLSGTGLAQATINKTSLTFGMQTVGTTSAPKQATIKNNLPTALTFSTVTTGDFAESDTCSGSVPANGGTCILNVTFTPTATGTRTGTLTVNNSSIDTPFTVSLTGTGK